MRKAFLLTLLTSLMLVLMPISTVISTSTDNPQIIMCIYDGYKSNYDLVFDYIELSNVSMQFSFFIATLNISDPTGARGTFETIETMRWNEIENIADAGHEICSHGFDDTDLTTCNETYLHDVMNDTQVEIEKKTGVKPYVFSPHGGATNSTVQAIMDDYYVIGLDISSYGYIFDTTATGLNYMGIPAISGIPAGAWGTYGEWKNGSNTDWIKGNFTQRLNWLVGNGSDYAMIVDFHHVVSNIADCREDPYGDVSYATFKWAVDTLVEYRDTGENLTISTFDDVFATKISQARTNDLMIATVGTMALIGIISVLVTVLKRYGSSG